SRRSSPPAYPLAPATATLMPTRHEYARRSMTMQNLCERMLAELHEPEPAIAQRGHGPADSLRRAAPGLVHVQQGDRAGGRAVQRRRHLRGRVRRPRVPEHVEVDNVEPEVVHDPHGDLVAVR